MARPSGSEPVPAQIRRPHRPAHRIPGFLGISLSISVSFFWRLDNPGVNVSPPGQANTNFLDCRRQSVGRGCEDLTVPRVARGATVERGHGEVSLVSGGVRLARAAVVMRCPWPAGLRVGSVIVVASVRECVRSGQGKGQSVKAMKPLRETPFRCVRRWNTGSLHSLHSPPSAASPRPV